MTDVRDDGYPGTAELEPAAPTEAIGELESALNSLVRLLKQARLHGFILDRAQADVDRAGMALLYVLYVQGASPRLTELAEHLHIDAPAVSRKVQQLERAGLVGRGRDQGDGRATRLWLTESGRGTIDRILAARRDWLAAVTADWPAGEQAEFARLLRRFAGDVDRHLEDIDVCDS